MDLKYMFYPRSVAVIGATNREGKVGYAIMKNLENFNGRVYPVNPKYDEVLGLKCYKSVLDIEDEIDLAIIVVPNVVVPQVLEECGKKGVKSAVIISAGFSEVGNYELEEKIKEIAKRYNIRIIGPNCLGIMNTHINLNATFAKVFPPKGGVSIISQSGAVLNAILDIAPLLNIGFSKVVSIGNKVDVQESDLMEYFLNDEDTKMVVLYIEGLKDKRFLNVAKKLSKKKPIIALKSGRTDVGKKAAKSHTGSLAGEDEIYEAVFKESGIVRAYTFEELVDLIHIFSTQPTINSNEIGIITNAGGFGVLAADSCVDYGMKLANFEDSTVETLKNILPKTATISNPLDIIGDATPERYKKVVDVLSKDKNVKGLLVILTPQEMTKPLEVAKSIIEVKTTHEDLKLKPLITSFVGGVSVKGAKSYLRKNGIPSYITPENGIKALSYLYKYSLLKVKEEYDEYVQKVREEFSKIKKENEETIKKLLSNPNEYNVKSVLKIYGFPVPEGYLVKSEDEAELYCKKLGKCVMKIVSPQILHKTDAKGVIIKPENPREAFRTLIENAKRYAEEKGIKDLKIDGVLVEEYIEKEKMEIIIGSKRDKIFGSVVMVGLGGVFVEVLKDVSFGISPITRDFAYEMLKSLKSYKVLEGVRGRPRKDIEFVVDCLIKIGVFMDIHEEIKEMDLNPVFVFNDGEGGCIGDAKIILE
ncbi:acetyl coenzyme A synthetase (ADP forming), alpha domain protein [Methanocaldococcus vulcanius M7]|uniref:acetate--CoA ligase (ADP-forming) n=1 Tax=Methanocaldococcus vulcanius (strain ATCC 700851 / DSM 12094 / M7) TaxID=579137 RepID=C9RHX0_METVM|nr:acetate--CoA ligase [Methanocaldococcus vulcanius]ACX73172.1 acetyl coenzyme A synthetase (ADP forming), alpha domain protein [Methanocaldococcus vulcanius M7]